ncbi:MAG: hypothetical protein ETSY1_34615 [Candidatus Entotheonella factor]|uniref:Uncharacterized protein n=1 Tax=Entotheonella factor TaxID=1429438 RepID=W4L8S5_ENTF1|nr:MAG: hypothetical protein ETSY1_34615 [Candidatus Entotheonella factor]
MDYKMEDVNGSISRMGLALCFGHISAKMASKILSLVSSKHRAARTG